jgi:prepilin-type N-terminal cleavage/methylation domain-containing protein
MRTNQATGFSMIELLVVLAIIGVASALIIPMFGKGRVDDGTAERRAPACVGLHLARSKR